MFTKTMRKCKRRDVKTCAGIVRDTQGRKIHPTEGWVYWCGVKMNGWHQCPCEHYGKK